MVLFFSLVLASFSAAGAQAADPAEVGVFEDVEVPPDTRFEVPVSVRNVEGLYAVDITLTFDAEIMQIEDANPSQDGVQLGLGTFLDAGLVLFNEANNETGTIRFAMTQVNPSDPKSGEGVLLVLYAQAVEEGQGLIEVVSVELANRMGEALPASGVGSAVSITNNAVEVVNTPIPVQDPTMIIQVPTPEATMTPTDAPDPTPIPTSEPVNETENDVTEAQDDEILLAESKSALSEETGSSQEESGQVQPSSDQPSEGFSLLRYWWVVVLLAAAAIGLAIYLAATRR
jgi:hypothetical protein